VTALAILTLLGCFKPYEELPVLDFDEVPFDNGLVESADARVRTFSTGLPCPDGARARFHLVYRADTTAPVPVALVFHSGAFDYVLNPDARQDDPIYGATWRADSRLDRDWADKMVWETLGMYPEVVEPAEDNQGALPAALVDAGIAQLYPGNCWGDLWHDEEGYQDNDFSYENMARNGRTFAWWMVRILFEEGFAESQGIELPIALSGDLYLAGLGDGGRGAVELLTHDGLPPVSGILLDSTPDIMSPYLDPIAELTHEAEGIRRIWPEELDQQEIDDWSLLALVQAHESTPAAPPPTKGGTTGDTGSAGDTGSTGTAGDTGTSGDTGGGGLGDGGLGDGGFGDGGFGDGGATDTGGDTAEPAPETGGIDNLADYDVPPRIVYVWSQGDPRQPQASAATTAAALDGNDSAWVIDTQARGHVFTNADVDSSRTLVDFLLTGERGDLAWQSDSGSDGPNGLSRLPECEP